MPQHFVAKFARILNKSSGTPENENLFLYKFRFLVPFAALSLSCISSLIALSLDDFSAPSWAQTNSFLLPKENMASPQACGAEIRAVLYRQPFPNQKVFDKSSRLQVSSLSRISRKLQRTECARPLRSPGHGGTADGGACKAGWPHLHPPRPPCRAGRQQPPCIVTQFRSRKIFCRTLPKGILCYKRNQQQGFPCCC